MDAKEMLETGVVMTLAGMLFFAFLLFKFTGLSGDSRVLHGEPRVLIPGADQVE